MALLPIVAVSIQANSNNINYPKGKKRKRKILFKFSTLNMPSIKLSLTYWKIQTYILKKLRIIFWVLCIFLTKDYRLHMKVKIKVNVFPIMLHSTSFYRNSPTTACLDFEVRLFSVLPHERWSSSSISLTVSFFSSGKLVVVVSGARGWVQGAGNTYL